MNISILRNKTIHFTKEAKEELRNQVIIFVNNVITEAERIELIRCRDVSQVQITPYTVGKAVEHIIEQRKVKSHWFPAIACPFINGIAGIGVAYGFEHQQSPTWILSISAIILVGTLIYQITYHIMNN